MSETGRMGPPAVVMAERRLLIAGCGATGSWTLRALGEAHPGVEAVCLDRDVVASENLSVAALDGVDPATVLGRD